MTSPEKPDFKNEIQELLSKLRVAQQEILQNADSGFFVQALKKFGGASPSSDKNKRFSAALHFLNHPSRLSDEDLSAGLRAHAITLAEIAGEFPAEHDTLSRIDYLSFVGLSLGGIPEDRYLERQHAHSGSASDNATACLKLVHDLVRLALEIPDRDVKSVVLRGLLGAVGFLEMERDGKEDTGPAAEGDDDGTAELFETATRLGVARDLVSRALEIAESEHRQTQERRKKRRFRSL